MDNENKTSGETKLHSVSQNASREKTLREQAQDELIEERTKEYKGLLKKQLRLKQEAQIVVQNIEREIQSLELKIEQEIKDVRKA